jgi:hypothetical protein
MQDTAFLQTERKSVEHYQGNPDTPFLQAERSTLEQTKETDLHLPLSFEKYYGTI